jgi:hypothetical protein
MRPGFAPHARERSRRVQTTELRPLGAGEMLDRAITLYVRRFALIVTVLAVVSVPIVLLEALVAPQTAHMFSDFGRLLAAGPRGAASQQAADQFARDSAMTPQAAFVLLGASAARLLMWCASLAVMAAAYAGVETSVAAAYRLALRRWAPLLLVTLAFVILGTFAAVPVFMLYLLLIVAVVALSALHQTVATIAVAIVGFLVVLAGAAVVGSLAFMSYELAAVAMVTETRNPAEAIGIGLRRAFAPRMKRRTLVAGLVMLLVSQVGALPILALAAVAVALTHVDALYFAVIGAGTVLLDGLVASFAVVYAVDARVRREGFDLVLPEPPPVPA